MPRGKVSPHKAARMLGRHPNTIYSWCRGAERGDLSKFTSVERDPDNKYFKIDIAEVRRLQQDPDDCDD